MALIILMGLLGIAGCWLIYHLEYPTTQCPTCGSKSTFPDADHPGTRSCQSCNTSYTLPNLPAQIEYHHTRCRCRLCHKFRQYRLQKVSLTVFYLLALALITVTIELCIHRPH